MHPALRTLQNTSIYPTAAVRAVVGYALKVGRFDRLPDSGYVRKIQVGNCSVPFRGLCTGERILLRVGSPERFLTPVFTHYRKTAPSYQLHDWKETLVVLAAHEAQHSRDFATGRGVDEVGCEQAGYRALQALRRNRQVVDTRILRAVEEERLRLSAREEILKFRQRPPKVLNKMSCNDDPSHEKIKSSFSVFRKGTTFLGYLGDVYLGNCLRCDSTLGFDISQTQILEEDPASFSGGKRTQL